MSEDIAKFLEAVRENPSLQQKLQAEDADPIRIAAEVGFTITQADLIRVQARYVENLSDEELEQAAGGTVSLAVLPVAVGATCATVIPVVTILAETGVIGPKSG